MTYLVRWTGGPAASAATSWADLWEAVLLQKKIKHVAQHRSKYLPRLLPPFFHPLPVLFLASLVVWFVIVDFCLLVLILFRIWGLTLAAWSWLGLIRAWLQPSLDHDVRGLMIKDNNHDVDEPSSSLGQYFRIFAHIGSRVTLAVTLLSSQWHYCSGEVILLFTFISFYSYLLFCFSFRFFRFSSHSCSCHSRYHSRCLGRSDKHLCRS